MAAAVCCWLQLALTTCLPHYQIIYFIFEIVREFLRSKVLQINEVRVLACVRACWPGRLDGIVRGAHCAREIHNRPSATLAQMNASEILGFIEENVWPHVAYGTEGTMQAAPRSCPSWPNIDTQRSEWNSTRLEKWPRCLLLLPPLSSSVAASRPWWATERARWWALRVAWLLERRVPGGKPTSLEATEARLQAMVGGVILRRNKEERLRRAANVTSWVVNGLITKEELATEAAAYEVREENAARRGRHALLLCCPEIGEGACDGGRQLFRWLLCGRAFVTQPSVSYCRSAGAWTHGDGGGVARHRHRECPGRAAEAGRDAARPRARAAAAVSSHWPYP